MVAQLESAGVTDPYFLAAVQELGSARARAEVAEATTKLLEAAGKARDAVTIKGDLGSGETSAKLDAIATVLGWGLSDPRLSLLVSDIQFTTASVYNNVARRVSQEQIQQLTSLAEERLKALRNLSLILRRDVEELNEARQRATKLSEDN
jgi:hypothetical protein